MHNFFDQTRETKKGAMIAAASSMQIDPFLIEKDLWVVITLSALFSYEDSEIFLFKGGTCLSKAYGLIERFSEDIDLTLDREKFSGELSTENLSSLSRNKREKMIAEVREKVLVYLEDSIIPFLKKRIQEISKEKIEISSDPKEPLNINVFYPSLFAENAANRYILPRILIEFGMRGDHFPSEERVVTSYLHQQMPKLEAFEVRVRALSPTRTFFEKLTLLHAEHNRPDSEAMLGRVSRHYYDVYQLAQKGIFELALKEINLLRAVINNKMLFFPSEWTQYDAILKEGMRLLPSKSRLKEIQNDYQKMREMFFNITTVPTLEEILQKLKEIEAGFNRTLGLENRLVNLPR